LIFTKDPHQSVPLHQDIVGMYSEESGIFLISKLMYYLEIPDVPRQYDGNVYNSRVDEKHSVI